MTEPSANDLIKWDKSHIWHPFTQMRDWNTEEQVIISSGKGSWLFDAEGNRYLDGVASMWTNVHGHCRMELNDALKEQVERLEHSTLLGLANEPSIILAKMLADTAPTGLDRVFYSDNGSTAMEVALKMAYQFQVHIGKPEKSTFITFRNAYHGDTIGAVSLGGIHIFHEAFRPLLFKTIQAPSPYCYRCELGHKSNTGCGMACIDALENIITGNSEHLAGLCIEPLLQGAGGMIVSPPGFLRKVRELCDRYGIIMIADEVATGFGRTGTMFSCQQEDVIPDIMALSKGITAGYLPLGATMVKEYIYDAFLGDYSDLKTFFHGHTFTGNPLACAVAIRSLELFAADGLLEALKGKISLLAKELERFSELPHVGNTRQCGMAAGIELVAHKNSREPYPWEKKTGIKVCLEARKRSIFTRPLGNTVVVFPPLSISDDEIRFLADGLYEAVIAVTS